MNTRPSKIRSIACCICAAIVVLMGVISTLIASTVVHYIMQSQVTLGPNSPATPFWANIPTPLSTKVYLFNVSNAEDVVNKGVKPILSEVGPYSFDEYHTKTKISWNDNDTVTYQQARRYQLAKSHSQSDLDAPVTIVNAPAATLGAMMAPMSKIERGFVDMAVMAMKERLFTSQSPRNIVFDGYKDPLLDAVADLAEFGVHFPGQMDKFAIFYQRNNSDWYDGVFNMYTGRNNLSLANKMHSWNYASHTAFFPGKCGEVRGNAELFTPLEGPQEFVELYSNDLCRPMTLYNVGDASVKGVSGIRYEMFPSFFANRSVNPDNACFDGGREWPSGVFNASACRFNAPVFLSQPHFFQGDPYYVNQFEEGSLTPNKDKHSTYFVIDPVSGIPLEVVARFQVNFLVENLPDVHMFKNLKHKIFFPAFWFETRMILADNMTTELWIVSHIQVLFVAIGLGSALMAFTIIVVFLIRHWATKSFDAEESNVATDEERFGQDEDAADSSVAPLLPDSEPIQSSSPISQEHNH